MRYNQDCIPAKHRHTEDVWLVFSIGHYKLSLTCRGVREYGGDVWRIENSVIVYLMVDADLLDQRPCFWSVFLYDYNSFSFSDCISLASWMFLANHLVLLLAYLSPSWGQLFLMISFVTVSSLKSYKYKVLFKLNIAIHHSCGFTYIAQPLAWSSELRKPTLI